MVTKACHLMRFFIDTKYKLMPSAPPPLKPVDTAWMKMIGIHHKLLGQKAPLKKTLEHSADGVIRADIAARNRLSPYG